MKDIISFDVKLTPNQKLAQDKLNQVHQLYDEIEKLLGTQDVFKRPHLFMELPKKEPQTNEEWLHSLNTEELADVLNKIFMTRTFCHICPEGDVCDLGYECKYHGGKICDFVKWLKATHRG